MTRVEDLINFEEVREVIQINAIHNPEEILSKYVISENLRENLVQLFSQLRQNKHKSVHVVGNYGTGKSHLLAFISLVLKRKELRNLIKDESVKKSLDDLDREYAIIQFELPATQKVSLVDIFYDQLQEQLESNYGVSIRAFESEREYDHKKFLDEVVAAIKQKHPNMGLAVIIDEVSDFMKQKTQEDMAYDLQFLRQLGEVSQTIDFIYIGSMQEHVFTSPRYVSEADNISRIQERFQIISIRKEDINKVIGLRVVRKDSSQIITLRGLLEPLKTQFPTLITDEEIYVQLYPVHPYVTEVFRHLPYFEHRGIISFAVTETKKLLNEDFPALITYDKIYDLISETHAIKNLEEVKPVVDTISNLDLKIDLLEHRFQKHARKIVKALAVLKLSRETGKNGATAQELANTLFIEPETKIIQASDYIDSILKKIRDVTDGQFITRTNEGNYFLDLHRTVDYDVVIKNEIQNLPDGAVEREFQSLLADKLELSNKDQIVEDTALWKSKNTYRNGWFIIESKRTKKSELEKRDYQFHVLSHYKDRSDFGGIEGQIVLNPEWDEETITAFGTLAAINQLIQRKYGIDVMPIKKENQYEVCAKKLVTCILQNGTFQFANKTRKVSTILESASNLDALFNTLKSEVLEDYFQNRYSKHPAYEQRITLENIEGTVESCIKDLCSKPSMSGLNSQSINLLRSLNLIEGDSVQTSNSEFADLVLKTLGKAGGKNVALDDVLDQLGASPYGIEKEMTFLLLSALLLNGEIVFVEKGGKRIFASDFPDAFGKDLSYFERIKYLLLEEELPIKFVNALFDALKLQKGLLRNKKTWPVAVRSFAETIIKIRNDIQEIQDITERLKDDKFYPSADVQSIISDLRTIPIEKMEKVRSVADFKRLELTEDDVSALAGNYTQLLHLISALRDYTQEIKSGLRYMDDASIILFNHPSLFGQRDAEELRVEFRDSKAIVGNIKQFLKEDERRPVKGKIQQFKRRYIQLYFSAHEKSVGKSAPWTKLDELLESEKYFKLQKLAVVRCINATPFHEIAFKIAEIKEMKCVELASDNLEASPICSRCQFPEGGSIPLNIGKDVEAISNKINSLDKSWKQQIFSEIEKNKDQLKLLGSNERDLIDNLIKSNLEKVDDDSIKALNNLFNKLEVIDVKLDEFFDFMTQTSDVLTMDELNDRFEKFKNAKIGSIDSDRVRLRLVKTRKNGLTTTA
ncbi:MAG: hypothetical protein IAX21_04010 [Candidatus Bathyarchaeota archaeon]|nr:MAG: hypothetical protein IAX21_04010 [Candidatus Bathyarchaeota archaeon]